MTDQTRTTHDKPDDTTPVDLHLRLTVRARRALRMAAGARGMTMSALVEHGAMAEAQGLGLTVACRVGGGRQAVRGAR